MALIISYQSDYNRQAATKKRVEHIRVMVFITVLIGSLLNSTFAQAEKSKVAIVIDDMGYRTTDTLAFDLPTHVTFAILPHTEQSTRFAHRAQAQGRSLLLHLPMESLHPQRLGPGALVATMDASAITSVLDLALASVPHVTGVNNHMGSKLTQLTFPMTTLMKALADRNLYFIDSRTTRFTKARKIAAAFGLPVLERKVFLDHELNEHFINQQFKRLVQLSRQYGHAIGIGHPHPLTLQSLSLLIELEKSVEFVSVDSLIQLQDQTDASHTQRHKGILPSQSTKLTTIEKGVAAN